MICEKCKAELSEGALFCGNCGAKVPVMQTAPAQSASAIPSEVPVMQPAQPASAIPNEVPVMQPAQPASAIPSEVPAMQPTQPASAIPNEVPAMQPTQPASAIPNEVPVMQPATAASAIPSEIPVMQPAQAASAIPSEVPVMQPATAASAIPSEVPVMQPAQAASPIPSEVSAMQPATAASAIPSEVPAMQPATASSAIPSEIPAMQPAQNIPEGLPNATKPKKKAKALPFIIGGAGVAVVGAAAAVVMTCQADVQHTFLGDEKYAAAATKQLLSTATDGVTLPAVSNTLSTSVSGVTSLTEISRMGDNYGETDSVTGESHTVVSKKYSAAIQTVDEIVGSVTGTNGAKATLTYSADLKDDFIEELAKQAGVDAETYKSVLEYCKDISVIAAEKSDDNSIQFSGQLLKNGENLFDIGAYYNKEGDTYISFPFVNENEAFYVDLPVADEEDDPEEEAIEIDTEKLSELYDDLLEDYSKALSNAEIVYESNQETLGSVEFKGKTVTAEFDNDALAEMFESFATTFDNCEYLDELLDEYNTNMSVSDIANSLESSADSVENSDVKLTVVYYITKSNEVRGAKITLSGKNNDGSKTSVSAHYLKDKHNFAFVMKLDKAKLLEITCEMETENAGTLTISQDNVDSYGNSDGTELYTLKVKFSDVKVENIMGNDMVTGKFNFSIKGEEMKRALNKEYYEGDEKFSPYSLVADSGLSIEITNSGSGIQQEVSLDNKACGSVSYTLLIEPNDADVASGEFSEENTIKMYDRTEDDETKYRDFEIELLDAVIGKAESDDGFNDLITLSGGNVSSLKEERDTLVRNRDRYTVYSAYDENSTRLANEYAQTLGYRWLDEYGISAQTDKVVKLYYDANGSLTVIDNAGIDQNNLDKYLDGVTMNSAYAEIFINTKRNYYRPIGVSVVLTDSSDSLPDDLPDIYNYLDECYSWETNEYNYIGLYVVGTYPYLSSGESTQKAEEEAIVQKVAALDADAKTVYDAVSKFIASGGIKEDYYKEGSYQVNLTMDNGVWKEGYNTSDLITDIRQYLDKNKVEINDGTVCIRIKDGKLVGVSVNEDDYYTFTNEIAFRIGYTNDWSFIEGYYGGYCCGTYPKVVSYTGELSDDAISKLTGTWYSDDGNFSVTESDIKDNFYDFSIGYSGITVTLKDSEKLTMIYYDFYNGNLSTETYELYSDGEIIYSSEEDNYYYSRENYRD